MTTFTDEETQHILGHTEGDYCADCSLIHARVRGGDALGAADREHLIELFGGEKPHCAICRTTIEKLRRSATGESEKTDG